MAFRNYDKQGLIFQEFIECITFNFKNANDAFKYFANKQVISKNDLKQGILKLLPKRFNNIDIEKLYGLISRDEGITQKQFIDKFQLIFQKNNPNKHRAMSMSMSRLESSNIANIPQSASNNNGSMNEFYSSGMYGRSILSQKSQNVFRVSNNVSRYQSSNDTSKPNSQLIQQPSDSPNPASILYRLKSIFKDDLDNLLKKFREYDPDDTGIVSNLQFRKVLRNWGFCGKDIDLLFQIVEQFNGYIKYKQVIHKLSNRRHD